MLAQTLQYPPIKTELHEHGDMEYTLSIYPLNPGFGYTLGNSIRRILLSSVPGYAVTRVRVNDLTHEYQPIKGVKEDALDVLLNLKSIRARINTDATSATITLKTTKGGDIYAKDFDKNSEVDIVNKDLYICSLSEGAKLEIEVEINRGYGYTTLEKRDLRGNTEPTSLLIDALYTPVRNVSLEVEQTRVGDQTNFDRVNIKFETDGTVDGKEVAEYATALAVEMFSNIHSALAAGEAGKNVAKALTKSNEASEDVIELSPRLIKILKKSGITTNAELKARFEEIQEMPGLGKEIDEIEKYIKELS